MRGREESEGQRDCSTDGWLSVVELERERAMGTEVKGGWERWRQKPGVKGGREVRGSKRKWQMERGKRRGEDEVERRGSEVRGKSLTNQLAVYSVSHFSPNVLSHGNESYAEHSQGLMAAWLSQ